uniref:Histone domain-containing protein n=2 Tax=Caenorhabditis tropicalis TaxID=1561998 RepID=A0A1I7UHB3_9PELO
MLQMHSDMDGPTIEEIVDTSFTDEQKSEEDAFRREIDRVKREMYNITSRPGWNNNSDELGKIINIMTRYIDKWEEDEEYDSKINLRQDSIKKFREKRDDYQKKQERAEEEYFERRQRQHEESVMRENARRLSSYRDDDITRRSNRTGLNQNSYEGSSTHHRTHGYDFDEDSENRPISHHDRYRASSKKSNQSTMYHQRRDESSSLHRSHYTMNGTSHSQQQQQVRMRSGKSRVTKTNARKYRPGQRALAEIRQYQKSTDLLIQKAPFARLVHEIVREETNQDYRVRADAILALQEAAEAFMVEMFEGSTLISNHAKRVTLMPTDIQLYRRLCLRNL